MPTITVVRGDITTQNVDAIVNAANPSLLGGGGVDGAIHRRGGPAILDACRALRATAWPDGLPVGEAAWTTAGALPARWVIHTVGPIYGRTERDAELLAACHISSLRVADEIGATTVALPAISTGAFGYPVSAAAPVAIAAVRMASTSVREVRFVLFDEAAFDVFRVALDGPIFREAAGSIPLPMSDLSNVREVYERLSEIQLVDCREPYEWDAGRIAGAIHIPVNSIMAGAGSDLDKDTPIAVICRSGNRSELATMMLQARGYDATNVEGGMEAWASAGLPFEASDGSPGRVA